MGVEAPFGQVRSQLRHRSVELCLWAALGSWMVALFAEMMFGAGPNAWSMLMTPAAMLICPLLIAVVMFVAAWWHDRMRMRRTAGCEPTLHRLIRPRRFLGYLFFFWLLVNGVPALVFRDILGIDKLTPLAAAIPALLLALATLAILFMLFVMVTMFLNDVEPSTVSDIQSDIGPAARRPS